MWIDLLNVVHGVDSSIGASIVGEANETESTAATSVAILDHDLRGEVSSLSLVSCV
jgi:hypothetical protein